MGLRTHPSQRQRRIAIELRKLRDSAGLTAAGAGGHVDLSGAHLGHVESGRTSIPEDKLRGLLKLYGVRSETFTEALVAWSQAPRGWWHRYRRYVSRDACDLAEAETLATDLRSFEPMHLPGLVQTAEYVRANMHSAFPEASDEFVEQGVQFRMARREALSGDGAKQHHLVIHEAAFHMRFVDVDIMRQQILHLIELAGLPHITIQLVPFRTHFLPSVGSPFVLFGSPHPALRTVYLEHDVGCLFLDESDHLERYDQLFSTLSSLALPPVPLPSERQSHGTRDSLSLLQYLLYTL